MGKFFNGKIRTNRDLVSKKAIVIGVAIALVLLFILILIKNNSKKNNVVLELKDITEVELKADLPEKIDFFNKLENYDINKISVNFNSCTTDKVGECTVTITTEGNSSKDVIMKVVDTTPPTVKTNDVTINYGDTYEAKDFVEECKDLSNDECEILFSTTSVNQDGDIIDFTSYTEPGEYTIKIYAKDSSNNATENYPVKLTILDEDGTNNNVTKTEPVECKYGSLEVDESVYPHPLAIIVGDTENNCALNRDLWDNENVLSEVNTIAEKDIANLKKDISGYLKTEYPTGAKLTVYPHYAAVWNKEGTGLVGFIVYVKLYAISYDSTAVMDADDNLKAAYYLKQDGTREYEKNIYNIG